MMHQGVSTKTRANSYFPLWIQQRELGQRVPLGHSDAFCKHLYSTTSPCHSWGGRETSRSEHGGLFSLDFSPEGSLLVAGCQKNSFLMFDPLSRRLIRTVRNAHRNCVRTVKFLDSRIFATGGVDETVCVWDARNLKTRIRTLRGHSSIIGNIDFSPKNESLITSTYDGFISIWDMNTCNQTPEICRKIFRLHEHMRLRLNPDKTKMIISTTRGYFMIVHELDLNTLAQDLDELEVELFGLAYLHQRLFAPCENWSPFPFHRRRNRVEIVADFPRAGGSNVISALEIHPQGWSAFSRSSIKTSDREWTCVHDIQEKEPSELKSNPDFSGVLAFSSPSSNSRISPFNRKAFIRYPRLTHYIEEPGFRNAFVESLDISADGRLVCSPLKCGIRLLAFSPECSEQSVSWFGTRPRRLHNLSTHTSHRDRVVCVKFSPRHCLLVSGCLDGKLAWYQPIV